MKLLLNSRQKEHVCNLQVFFTQNAIRKQIGREKVRTDTRHLTWDLNFVKIPNQQSKIKQNHHNLQVIKCRRELISCQTSRNGVFLIEQKHTEDLYQFSWCKLFRILLCFLNQFIGSF